MVEDLYWTRRSARCAFRLVIFWRMRRKVMVVKKKRGEKVVRGDCGRDVVG